MSADSLKRLSADITGCQLCPRLRSHCLTTASTKRAQFAQWTYWGKPVAGFGEAQAQIWIIGLAPAAHGANRTGRVFTGDRSGDFLFAALHRAGLANQRHSVARDDGLQLSNVYISSAARCAPPGNKPSPVELAQCSSYLDREWELLAGVRVILALGKVGWDAALALAKRHGCDLPMPAAKFAHGAQVQLGQDRRLIGSYHVSQQNTFTGKLTAAMFDAVIENCRRA